MKKISNMSVNAVVAVIVLTVSIIGLIVMVQAAEEVGTSTAAPTQTTGFVAMSQTRYRNANEPHKSLIKWKLECTSAANGSFAFTTNKIQGTVVEVATVLRGTTFTPATGFDREILSDGRDVMFGLLANATTTTLTSSYMSVLDTAGRAGFPNLIGDITFSGTNWGAGNVLDWYIYTVE